MMEAHKRPLLSLLVCTINDRITEVPKILLPCRSDITYIVAFQYTDSMFLEMIPAILKEREDVLLIPHPTTGISANRNAALNACHTEFAVFCDDDVRYTYEQLDTIIRTFRDHPEVDIACFQIEDYEGKKHKDYPTYSFDYAHTPKGYSYSSLEIAIRGDVQLPSFDERFGLGSTYLSCGEEHIFLYQSHCAGLNIRYFPDVICRYNPGPTPEHLFLKHTRIRRSAGAQLLVIHGHIRGFLRICKVALSQPGMKWRALCDMMDGYRYIAN